jgi:cobalt-zinc-cadmium efflux system membrane fusion protein
MIKRGLIVVAVSGTLLLACSRKAAAPEAVEADVEQAVMLTAAQVAHGGVRWEPAGANTSASAEIGMSATLPGQLTPNEDRTTRLGAPAGGRILAVRVSPGDRVRKGQVLVTLQSQDAAMAQAELSKAASAVSSARAQATYAKSARDRADRLLVLKAIPRQEYEKAIADEQLAAGELSQAEAELQRARVAARALGASDAPTGELAIRSPQDGVVLERSAIPGTVVEAGAPLILVTDPSQLWLTMSAPETAIGTIRVGAALRFTVPAYPAETFSARVTAVGAGLDADTRTLPVRATVTSASGRLKPAMFASVELPHNTGITPASGAAAALVLPADAVQLLGGKPVVFEVMPNDSGGGHFMARPVETGSRAGGRITITRGVGVGDLVVVKGAFAVKAAIEKGKMPKMEM